MLACFRASHDQIRWRRDVLEINVVEKDCEFKNLEQQWDKLVEYSESPSPFITWAWLHSWWKYYSDGRKLQILAIRYRGRLVGIAPFITETKRWLNIIPLRCIKLLGSEFVTSEYQDVIVCRKMAGHVRSTIQRFLSEQWRHRWDVLLLQSLPESSPTFGELKALPNLLHIWTLDMITSNYTRLPDSYDEYLAMITPKWRYRVRKKLRHISKSYQLQFVEAKEHDEMNAMLQDFMTIHGEGRRARGKPWSFQSEKFKRFANEACGLLFEKGMVKLYLLKANGQPISGVLSFCAGKKLFVYQQGIHPDYFQWSPGVLAFGYSIESAIASGIREIDFLRGGERYKKHWAKGQRRSKSLCVINKTLGGFVLAACIKLAPFLPIKLLRNIRNRAPWR